MNRFIKIFKSGKYPQGSFTAEDLDKIVLNFKTDRKDVPLTVDHKKEGPAFGWINDLKREGDYLLASFRDVTDEMKSWVKKKMYQFRSTEIYPDEVTKRGAMLRAVTMLGAASPAVQGLGAVAEFRADDMKVLAFVSDEYNTVDMFEAEPEKKQPDLFDKKDEKPTTYDWQVKYQSYKEQDTTREEIEQLKTKIKELEDEKKTVEYKITEVECVDFLEEMVKERKLLPRDAHNRKILDLMLSLDHKQISLFQEVIMAMPRHQYTAEEESSNKHLNYHLSLGVPNGSDLKDMVTQYMETNKITDMARYGECLQKVLAMAEN
jgi:hypothetical protein